MLLIKAGGGSALNWDAICRDIASLIETEPVILVHGANARRAEIAEKLSVPVRTVVSPSGISSVYTDEEALDVFLMAYPGLVNKKIVAKLHLHGVNAVGLSGVDGGLWLAKPKKDILIRDNGKIKLLRRNLTGRVEKINTDLIRLLLDGGYTPVLCAPALSYEKSIVNTDNDWAVSVMAESLGVKRIVSLFEAPGLLKDPEDEQSLIPHIDRNTLDDYMDFAKNRMKKKMLGAKKALEGGVETIYWGDGRTNDPIRNALNGSGTIIS